MKRRELLAMSSAGMLVSINGCLGQWQVTEGLDQVSDDNVENDDNETDGETNVGDDSKPDSSEDGQPVFTVTDLDPEEAAIPEGESVDVKATVINTGEEEGTQEIELRTIVGPSPTIDESQASESMTLEPEEEATVSFEGIALERGTYLLKVVSKDDEATGRLIFGDLAVQIEEYEENADPFEFESMVLSNTGGSYSILPEGLESDDTEPLSPIKTATYEYDVPPVHGDYNELYGYLLTSEEDAEQIDREALNAYESDPEGYDHPGKFVDETDFDTQSLLVFWYGDSSGPSSISVEFVGRLSEPERVYVNATRESGPLDAGGGGATVVRIDDPEPPDTLLVGEAYLPNALNPEIVWHALHTNQEDDDETDDTVPGDWEHREDEFDPCEGVSECAIENRYVYTTNREVVVDDSVVVVETQEEADEVFDFDRLEDHREEIREIRREFVCETDFSDSILVWVESRGPVDTSLINPDEVRVEDERLVVRVQTDHIGGGEAITYPTALIRITAGNTDLNSVKTIVADGWGDEEISTHDLNCNLE